MVRNILKILFIAWVVMWVIFTIRPIVKKSLLAEYGALFGRPLEERRAIVYGKELSAFLKYAKDSMPESATYSFKGFEEGSVDLVRADYYLYPRLRSGNPQFILTLDNGKYSLKKAAFK